MRQNAIALVALFLALGGTSLGAATLINGSQIKPHTIAKNRLTNKAIKQLKGARGPQGPAGAPGAAGAQGPAGPGARWAAVAPNGNTHRQSGGITVQRVTTGIYLVNFGVDVSNQLIVVSNGFYNDGSFVNQRVSLAGTCGDYDTVNAGFCAAHGVTSPANTVVVFLAGSGATQDHSFFVAAMP
jgi:hypothetical protein